MLKFITGNKDKFREVNQLLAPIKIKQVKLNLIEIQDLDARKIIRHKLKEALKHDKGPFIIEDDSLYFECLDGKLPGPLIRWFNDTIGNEGMLKLVKGMGDNKVYEQVFFAYAKNPKEIKYFSAVVHGKLDSKKGARGFGFDPIFRPQGHQKTYGQMPASEKHSISGRGLAATKLKKYLLKHDK